MAGVAHRRVYGIRWARECPPPEIATRSRAGGAKARGRAYEKALEGALPAGSHRGLWFEYEDRNGPGWCSPDFLLRRNGEILVLEAKLTATREAWSQVEDLYFPVLECALRGHARIGGAIVAKNLPSWLPSSLICDSLSAAWDHSRNGAVPCLHWLPRTPL